MDSPGNSATFLPLSAAALKESQMATLFFTCPTTHQQAPTGIETDVQSLQAAWKATLKVKCPHCGEVHEISVRETYINGALSDAADRLRQVI
jgi:hypothetical protein